MSDPEGFLNEDPSQQDYLNELVGGPEAMQKAPEVGGFVAGHEVQVDDQSTGESQVAVHTNQEQSASPFTTANPNYNPDQAKQT